MKTISNINTGIVRNKYSPPTRQTESGVTFDYLESDALNDLEDGIKETMSAMNRANLAIALAFAKIDREALYIQAGCKSYLEYLDKAEERLNMSRQTMSDYKRIGEIYLTYKAQLQSAGFREEGHLHKLRYLPRALEHHPADEVFDRIVDDSLRKFINFANPAEGAAATQGRDHDVEIPVTEIVIDGQNILQFAPDLEGYSKDEMIGYLKKIYEIKMKGNMPYILDLYDETESRAVENYLKRLRMSK